MFSGKEENKVFTFGNLLQASSSNQIEKGASRPRYICENGKQNHNTV